MNTTHNTVLNGDGAARPQFSQDPVEFIKAVAQSSNIPAICAALFPDGEAVGNEWICTNSARADKTVGSFSINLTTGACNDFASGDFQHDIVGTVAMVQGVKPYAASKWIFDYGYSYLGGNSPAPAVAVPPIEKKGLTFRPDSHLKLGKPTASWEYRNADGELICTQNRFDTPDGKQYRPLTRKPDGKWYWCAPDAPRPLYGLDRLAANPSDVVIVTEGEKAADAAGVICPDHVAIASMNGAQSPNKTDWSPLANRVVRLWPDNDKAGAGYVNKVLALLRNVGVASVQILTIPANVTEGWDAADALAQGWSPSDDDWVASDDWNVTNVTSASDDWNVTNVTSDDANVTKKLNVTENRLQPVDYAGSDVSDVCGNETSPIFFLKSCIENLATDAGAIFTPEALVAWAHLYESSPADYQRLRASAKTAKARVSDIDAHTKKIHQEKSKSNKPNVTNVTSSIGAAYSPIGTSLSPFGTSPSDDWNVTNLKPNVTKPFLVGGIPVTEGCLLYADSEGKQRRVIESKAARVVSGVLQGHFFHDQDADVWHNFTGTHWQSCPRGFALRKTLVRWFETALDPLGFKPAYIEGVIKILTDGNYLEAPAIQAPAMPLANGQLDLATGELKPTTPDNAQTWVLPYQYSPQADCPTIKKWLRDSVGDDATVELLRAVLAALLRGGAKYQKFLALLGRGGTGKSTFLRLASAMMGDSNTTTTTLKQLEQNRFEAGLLYGKRLTLITDSDKYGGAVNTLKAITGQDKIRIEEKNKQQHRGFVYEGMVFIASNEAITSTDYTSGLERRRITVVFDHVPSAKEQLEWHQRGGESALHNEIPGLINWLLQLSESDIKAILDNPPQATREANFDAMTANNPLAEWVTSNCIPDTEAWTQIGEKIEERVTETSKGDSFTTSVSSVKYAQSDTRLYPNYLDWCKTNGREALSKRRFKGVVLDMVKTLGYSASAVKRAAGAGIAGLKLRGFDDDVFDWLNANSPAPAVLPPNDENGSEHYSAAPCATFVSSGGGNIVTAPAPQIRTPLDDVGYF